MIHTLDSSSPSGTFPLYVEYQDRWWSVAHFFFKSQQERFNPCCKLFLFYIYGKWLSSLEVYWKHRLCLEAVWRGWEWGFGVSSSETGAASLLEGCDLTKCPLPSSPGLGWWPHPPSTLSRDVSEINQLVNCRHVGGINQPGTKPVIPEWQTLDQGWRASCLMKMMMGDLVGGPGRLEIHFRELDRK